MSQVTFSNTRSQIAGQSISELAEKFGTPVFVYDAEVIRQRIESLRQFDVIRYAAKGQFEFRNPEADAFARSAFGCGECR